MSALHELTGDADAFSTLWPDTPRVFTAPMDLTTLFSSVIARHTVWERRHRPVQMAMVRDGRLTGEEPDADHPSSTLGLNGLHHTNEAIAAFTKRLSAELGHPVTGNAYVTPPGSKGYGPHWDTHHVWLAQVEGVKHWKLFRPVFAHPTELHGWKKIGFTNAQLDHFERSSPDFAVELAAGSVLYIPRGWVHFGHTEQEHSLHVTLGAHLMNRTWLLQQLLEQALDEAEFREALPPALSDADFGALTTDTLERLAAWASHHDHKQLGHSVWLRQQAEMITRK